MPTVDFTLEDLKQVFATKIELHHATARLRSEIGGVSDDLGAKIDGVSDKLDKKIESASEGLADILGAKIDGVKKMLVEDATAESGRLDRVERKLSSTFAVRLCTEVTK